MKLFNLHVAFPSQYGQMLARGNGRNVFPLSIEPEVIRITGRNATW